MQIFLSPCSYSFKVPISTSHGKVITGGAISYMKKPSAALKTTPSLLTLKKS